MFMMFYYRCFVFGFLGLLIFNSCGTDSNNQSSDISTSGNDAQGGLNSNAESVNQTGGSGIGGNAGAGIEGAGGTNGASDNTKIDSGTDGGMINSGGANGASGNTEIDSGTNSGEDSSAGTDAEGKDAGPASTDSGADVKPVPESGPFPPVNSLENDGPFTGVTNGATGPNNDYSLFYPEQLAPNGAKNPIVGWGSGGSTDPSWYTLLPHLATHGFVVIANNAVPGIGGEIGQGQDMIAGIDWLLAENGRPESPFFEKLDTKRIAATGYSMGSLATFTIASDDRLVTTIHVSGGNQTAGRINNLRAPAAFFCGDQPTSPMDMLIGDVARPNCDTDFEQATTPVFYGNFIGGSHLGVMTSPYMERIRVAFTGWLRWQLMDDMTLKSMFVGDQCDICNDPNWTVQQKGLL